MWALDYSFLFFAPLLLSVYTTFIMILHTHSSIILTAVAGAVFCACTLLPLGVGRTIHIYLEKDVPRRCKTN